MSSKLDPESWRESAKLQRRSWLCGFCGKQSSSDRGYFYGRLVPPKKGATISCIAICSECGYPTFFSEDGKAHPGAPPGEPVERVPADIDRVYEEARRALAVGACTGAYLLCREILVSIALDEGSPDGQRFEAHLQFLEREGLVPKKARPWTARIRALAGVETTDHLPDVSRQEAEQLLTFVEYMLRFNYEFPGRAPDTEPGAPALDAEPKTPDEYLATPQERRGSSRSRK